jgi:hypothetical protein
MACAFIASIPRDEPTRNRLLVKSPKDLATRYDRKAIYSLCGYASASKCRFVLKLPDYSSITGGSGNTTIDLNATVTGGTGNTAGSLVIFEAGIGSSVLGGSGNNAGGRNTVVIGGQNITDNNDNSIAPKPPFP